MAATSLPRSRLALRGLTIALLFGKHWLRWWLGWWFLLVTLAGKARRREWFGQVVLDLFPDLGATFIKGGQIMSTPPDLIPHHILRALEQPQDPVGPFP